MKTKSIIISGIVGLLLMGPLSGYCSNFLSINIGSDGVNITTNFDTPNYYPVPGKPEPGKPEPNRKPEPKKPEPKKDNKQDNKKPGNNQNPGNNPGKPTTGGNGTHTPTRK